MGLWVIEKGISSRNERSKSKWLYRISQSKYDFTHELALDYLQNATGVEEGMYYQKGYHKAIIGFLGLDRIQHGNAEIDFSISYLQSAGANPENTWLTSELPLDEICEIASLRQLKIT